MTFRPFTTSALLIAFALSSPPSASALGATGARKIAVAPPYDTTHVYAAPDDEDRFAASFIATFVGKSTTQSIATVTPTQSGTTTQLLQTPLGTVFLFGFKTPIAYRFGLERYGYLVTDMTWAIRAARAVKTYRHVRIESDFGTTRVIVTDGHLPFFYGREFTSYEVSDLADTLAEATVAGCVALVEPFTVGGGRTAIVQFPGAYFAQIHVPTDR
jgi:hypothetical protein